MGIGVWCWGLRLLTLVHWSVSLWIRWNSGSSCSAEWWRSSLPTFFHLNLYYTPGSVLTAPELAESDLWTNHLNFSIFYRLRPAAFNVVLFVSAGPGPPVVNGIFEVCHWTWASFLTNPSRRPLLCLSVFCPRAAGSESLKCFLFHSPTLGNFWKIFFKMSVCSRSVFYGEVLRKWLRLEFLSPYLRLFSFCDYTIAHA